MASKSDKLFHIFATIFALRFLIPNIYAEAATRFLRPLDSYFSYLGQPEDQVYARIFLNSVFLLALFALYLIFEGLHLLYVRKVLHKSSSAAYLYPKEEGRVAEEGVSSLIEDPPMLATLVYQPLMIAAVFTNMIAFLFDITNSEPGEPLLDLTNFVIVSGLYIVPTVLLILVMFVKFSFNLLDLTITSDHIYALLFRVAFLMFLVGTYLDILIFYTAYITPDTGFERWVIRNYRSQNNRILLFFQLSALLYLPVIGVKYLIRQTLPRVELGSVNVSVYQILVLLFSSVALVFSYVFIFVIFGSSFWQITWSVLGMALIFVIIWVVAGSFVLSSTSPTPHRGNPGYYLVALLLTFAFVIVDYYLLSQPAFS